MDKQKLLNAREMAAEMDITPATFYAMLRDGLIPVPVISIPRGRREILKLWTDKQLRQARKNKRKPGRQPKTV